MLRGANGQEYSVATTTVLGEGVGGNGATAVPVQASIAGSAANLAAGTSLSLLSPVAGLATRGTILAPGISGGADAESDASLRARVLERKRAPAHGGNTADYVAWTKAALPGVTRVWVTAEAMGPGSVTVRFVMDGVRENGIPEAGDVDIVQAYLEAVRPVTAKVYVVAPIAAPLDFSVALAPDTLAVRAAVTASLADLIARERVPGDGDGAGKLLLSRLREAVSAAAGETDNAVSVPAADVVPDVGEIFTLGEITWLGAP